MPTLIIHAPTWAAKKSGKRNFATVMKTLIGKDYAIYNNLHARVAPGCKVVVLDKNAKQRAEGVLDRLIPTHKTANGIKRYDVGMKQLVSVKYRPEKLNRCGVAVI